MIEILRTVSPLGQAQVRQLLRRPSVYPDTWAIRHFAENKAEGDRFRDALMRAGGTLVFSTMSMIEFTQFDDERHALEAGAFIDSIMPNIFFAQSEPFEIRRRELAIMTGQTDQSPFGDEAMLAEFASHAAKQGELTAQHWFRWMHEERLQLRALLPGLAQTIFDGLNKLIQKYDSDPAYRRSVDNGLSDADGPRATLALTRAIFTQLQLDRTMTQSQNNAIDIVQTIVPAAYCDFVLLDRQWDSRLRTVGRSLAKVGVKARVARSYSQKSINEFLIALEGWQA